LLPRKKCLISELERRGFGSKLKPMKPLPWQALCVNKELGLDQRKSECEWRSGKRLVIRLVHLVVAFWSLCFMKCSDKILKKGWLRYALAVEWVLPCWYLANLVVMNKCDSKRGISRDALLAFHRMEKH